MSQPSLSKSAQMREMKAEGATTGEIARHFGVTYHQAYMAVVVNAGARAFSVDERGARRASSSVKVRARQAAPSSQSSPTAARAHTKAEFEEMRKSRLLDFIAGWKGSPNDPQIKTAVAVADRRWTNWVDDL